MRDMKKIKGTSISSNEVAQVGFEVVNHSLIINLGEDLDHHNAIHIRGQADKIIMNRNIKDIIFDFSRTNFMDSSGIGVIMGRYKKVTYIGGNVFVTGISDNVDRIFKLSGLYKVLHKYDTIQDALDVVKNKYKIG